MKKVLALAVLAIVLAIGGYLWTSRTPAASPFLVLHGNVDIRQVSLAFDGSGRISELHAEEGDVVKTGTVLARLDTRTLALQADQAAAQIEVQEQMLRRVRSGARPQSKSRACASSTFISSCQPTDTFAHGYTFRHSSGISVRRKTSHSPGATLIATHLMTRKRGRSLVLNLLS